MMNSNGVPLRSPRSEGLFATTTGMSKPGIPMLFAIVGSFLFSGPASAVIISGSTSVGPTLTGSCGGTATDTSPSGISDWNDTGPACVAAGSTSLAKGFVSVVSNYQLKPLSGPGFVQRGGVRASAFVRYNEIQKTAFSGSGILEEVSINFEMEADFYASVTPADRIWAEGAATKLTGSVTLTNGGRIDSQQFEYDIAAGDSANTPLEDELSIVLPLVVSVLYTDVLPLTVELSLEAVSVGYGTSKTVADTGVIAIESRSSFASTGPVVNLPSLSFARTGPVFNLPAGWDANIPELNIVNNRWLGPDVSAPPLQVPAPSTLFLLLPGLLLLGCGSRGRSRCLTP